MKEENSNVTKCRECFYFDEFQDMNATRSECNLFGLSVSRGGYSKPNNCNVKKVKITTYFKEDNE